MSFEERKIKNFKTFGFIGPAALLSSCQSGKKKLLAIPKLNPGFPGLDNYLSGIPKDKIIVIGAGVGKTNLSECILRKIYESGAGSGRSIEFTLNLESSSAVIKNRFRDILPPFLKTNNYRCSKTIVPPVLSTIIIKTILKHRK